MRQTDRLGLSGDLGPLLQELVGLSGNEPGYLLSDLGGADQHAAALHAAQVGHPADDADGTQPLIPGCREYRGPAAKAVPDYGDPVPVNAWMLPALQVVDRCGYISRYRPQVIPAAAAPAAPVVEHQRVPTSVAQFGSQVKVLFQTRAAMQ